MLDPRHAGQARELFRRRRVAQADQQGMTAAEAAQRLDGVAVDDAAPMQDLHAVAYRFDLGQDVGGQDHAVAAATARG